jgi:hypothetical protein
VTEDELLDVFRNVASARVTPGMVSPGALVWLEHTIDLAAARGADNDRTPNAEAAVELAERFFDVLLPRAQARLAAHRFGVVSNPAITPDALDAAIASFGFWPFARD